MITIPVSCTVAWQARLCAVLGAVFPFMDGGDDSPLPVLVGFCGGLSVLSCLSATLPAATLPARPL